MTQTRREFLQNTGRGLAALLAASYVPTTFAEEKSKYKTSDFSKDSDEILLARMLFGEARSCGDLEKAAIAYTTINRANDGKKYNGETVREAILKPWQYSCFNQNDINRKQLMDPEKYDAKSFQKCLEIVREVLNAKYNDPTNGATHYHALNVSPRWAKSSKMKKIGRIKDSKHIFYKEN